MRLKKFVGLVGYTGVGKDYIADILVREHGYTRLAFGDELKRMLIEIDPIYQRLASVGGGSEMEALEWDKREDLEYTREKLQNLGHVVRTLAPDHFVDIVKDAMRAYEKVVVTDIRYMNELDVFTELPRSVSRKLVYVQRDGYGAINTHSSEESIETLRSLSDTTINNNGNKEELQRDLSQL